MNSPTPDPTPLDDGHLDLSMRHALNEIPLPPGGLEAVLSAINAARQDEQKILTPHFTKRRWFKLSAGIAASLVGGGYFVRQRARQFDRNLGPANAGSFLADAIAKARGLIMLDHRSSDWEELHRYLSAKTLPTSTLALAKLRPLQASGCQHYAWRGGSVGLTCYTQSDHSLVHIFSIQRSQLLDHQPLPTTPTAVATEHGREWSHWAEADHYCALVAGKDGTSLAESLKLLG